MNHPGSSIQFGESVDKGFGPNKVFPFIYAFTDPDTEFFYESTIALKNRAIGVPVAANSSVQIPIRMSEDYNFLMRFIRYTVYSNTDPASEVYKWYDVDSVDTPITVSAGVNDSIDFQETAATPLVATVAAGTYTPKEFADAIKTALDAAGASTYTVTFGQTPNFNKYTITSDGAGGGGIFELLFSSGANAATSIRTIAGFGASDFTGALTYSSASALSYAHWMLEPFDYNQSYGTEYLRDIKISGSIRSSSARLLYGGAAANTHGNTATADGYLPIKAETVQGYEYGYGDLLTPYFIARSGLIILKIYNTSTRDLLVNGGVHGLKVRL